MKRTLSLILAAVMVISLAACAKKEEETAASQPVTTQAETPAETVGMANPMVEIFDTGDYSKELGIDIDASLFYSDATMFVIDGRIAECQFTFDNIEGEEVECTFRATKDETAGENLPGVYDSTLKKINSFDYGYEGGSFVIDLSANDAGDTSVYTWKIGEVFYSFVMQGKPSGMELAEALDSVMLAIGVDATGEATVETVEEEEWYELSAEDEVLTVRLKANATTGYQWVVKIWDEGTLELITDEYIEDAHPDGMLGVGGTYVASFKATDPAGRANAEWPSRNHLTFVYSRDPEGKEIPSKAMDMNITGSKIEILGVHEPDLTTDLAENGEYEATLSFFNMLEENELSFYALIGIPEIITFTEEEVLALQVGQEISLSEYGLSDIKVERVNWKDENTVEINDEERIEYNKDLNGWVIRGWDDDIYKFNKEMRQIHLTNETVIEDGMEEIMKTGNSGTIYDKMGTYWFADVKVTVKDGFAQKIKIYYHP